MPACHTLLYWKVRSWAPILYGLLAVHLDSEGIYESTLLYPTAVSVMSSVWQPVAPCARKSTGSSETCCLPREKMEAAITWWAVQVQSMEQTLKVEPSYQSMSQCKWYFPGRDPVQPLAPHPPSFVMGFKRNWFVCSCCSIQIVRPHFRTTFLTLLTWQLLSCVIRGTWGDIFARTKAHSHHKGQELCFKKPLGPWFWFCFLTELRYYLKKSQALKIQFYLNVYLRKDTSLCGRIFPSKFA